MKLFLKLTAPHTTASFASLGRNSHENLDIELSHEGQSRACDLRLNIIVPLTLKINTLPAVTFFFTSSYLSTAYIVKFGLY